MLIKQLYENFSNQENVQKQFKKTGKKNVLFVTPTITGENFYRIMMPYASLSRQGYGVALMGVTAYNPTQSYEKRVTTGLNSKHIIWASTIVFPFTTQPLKTIFQSIKTVNPNCKIVYNLDYNVFHLPSYHPLKQEITEEKINSVEENILYADLTLVDNEFLKEYLLNKHFEDKKMPEGLEQVGGIEVLPLIGNYTSMFGKLQPPDKQDSILKIAIPIGNWQYEELKQAVHSLSELQKKTNALEFVIMGGSS